MSARARGLHLVVALVAALIALAIAACTLNPQPLPPGYTGAEDPDKSDGFGPADAGTNAPVDPHADSGAPGSGDAGNSDGDAGDASSDDGGDAGSDASDGSSDGSAN